MTDTLTKSTESGSSLIQRVNNFDLEQMLYAATDIRYWTDILNRSGHNVVSEVLRGVETFEYYEQYPTAKIADQQTGSQHYFHHHREDCDEYGHFHLYLDLPGVPEFFKGLLPAPTGEHEDPWRTSFHVIGISMNQGGMPIELFTLNCWSSQEALYSIEQQELLLDQYSMSHAQPSWPLNQWLNAMLKLFRPQILQLYKQREETLHAWSDRFPNKNAIADEDLEITSSCLIDLDEQIEQVQAEKERRLSF